MIRIDCNTNTQCDVDLLPLMLKWGDDFISDFRCNGNSIVRGVDIGDQQDKLITTEAGKGVFFPGTPSQGVSEIFKQLITSTCSVGIIDEFKAVYIDEEKGKFFTVFVRMGYE